MGNILPSHKLHINAFGLRTEMQKAVLNLGKKGVCANFFMLIICIFTHFWFQNTIVWSHFQIICRKCTLTCLMPLVQKISYWHFVCNDFQRGRSWHSAFEPEDNLLSLPSDGFDQISQTPEIVQLTPFHTSSMSSRPLKYKIKVSGGKSILYF